MSIRHLDMSEVAALEGQGCTCAEWHRVRVKDPFRSDRVWNVHFGGDVTIGVLDGEAEFAGGLRRANGLRNCAVHNCTFDDHVFISDVRTLANYNIDSGAVVANVGTLATEGTTSFGNGTKIEVLNEGGGRELVIYERLSAQVAYLLTMYRHRPRLIEGIEQLVQDFVALRTSDRGRIEQGARVIDCGTVVNVAVGPHARVEGATELREGSIRSCSSDPVVIGRNVTMRRFIALSGSHVEDGALLTGCFVGQGVRIGRQFSAENCAFFANCEGYHGEACSVFAGPYTITHHKATLLIAGYLSFYNAGSGTNQSNHMYKLGPIHQGLLERGTKTGSSSYMLWPCRVGPFSVVLDKHSSNFDSSLLPYSYLTVENGKTLITPAMNLMTVGTRRDSAKWPKRDRRKDDDRLDQITFDVHSPWIMDRITRGRELLQQLAEATPKEQSDVPYKGAIIKRLMLRTACKYYDLAIQVYLGHSLAAFLETHDQGDPIAALQDAIRAQRTEEPEPWLDIAGLFTPQRSIAQLVDAVEDARIDSVEALLTEFQAMHDAYRTHARTWFLSFLARTAGGPDGVTAEKLAAILESWKTSLAKLNNMIAQDATKEFDPAAQLGYGIDGGAEERRLDFEAVHGSIAECSFLTDLHAETEAVTATAERLKEGFCARPAQAG